MSRQIFTVEKSGEKCILDENRVTVFEYEGTLYRKGDPKDKYRSYEVFNLLGGHSESDWDYTYVVQPVVFRPSETADIAALEAERDELRRRLDAVVAHAAKWDAATWSQEIIAIAEGRTE